jgi:hypothetical protein
MKYIIFAILFTSLLLLTSCGNSTPLPQHQADFDFEEQEFVLTPEASSLETAAVSRIPRLVVRLSIKPELGANGQPTGKRYGQAAIFWTDKSRSNGGSNLGGIASIIIRDANNLNATEMLSYNIGPVMSNIDLFNQTGYEDHLIKTSPISFNGSMCIEVWGLHLVSTNGYRFEHQMTFTETYDSNPVLSLCQSNSTKTGTELRLVNIKDVMLYADAGKTVTLPLGIINAGPRPAENVIISLSIADIATPLVSEQSGLFNCTTLSKPEISGVQITCTALRPITGFNTLPITIDATHPYDQPGNVYLIESSISTSTPEYDISNNSLASVIVYN